MTPRHCPTCKGEKTVIAGTNPHTGRGCTCLAPHLCDCREGEDECPTCDGLGHLCSECGDVAVAEEEPVCESCRTCCECQNVQDGPTDENRHCAECAEALHEYPDCPGRERARRGYWPCKRHRAEYEAELGDVMRDEAKDRRAEASHG